MNLMERRRALMEMCRRSINYVVVGEPTISDGIMTPNGTGWIQTPNSFDPGSSPWEITFSFVQFSTITWQNLLSSPGVLVQGLNGTTKLYLRSKGSSSHDICNGAISFYINQNQKTWIKIKHDNGQYSVLKSVDGSTWDQTNTIGSSKSISPGTVSFGAKASNTDAVQARYNLNDMEIKIDGATWWTAYT